MLTAFIEQALAMNNVVFVENQVAGRLLYGRKDRETWEVLVVSSGHIWIRRPSERSWTTTQIYVPDRLHRH